MKPFYFCYIGALSLFREKSVEKVQTVTPLVYVEDVRQNVVFVVFRHQRCVHACTDLAKMHAVLKLALFLLVSKRPYRLDA